MYPFSEGDSFATFRNIVDAAIKEIKELNNEYVLKASQTELEDYFIDKVTLEPLILHSDQRYIKKQTGVQIDVSNDYRRAIIPGVRTAIRGTKIDLAIPFEGDPMLWRIRASTYSMSGYPELTINDEEIEFGFSFPDDSSNAECLKNEIDRYTKSLTEAVNYLKNDVINHNNTAPNTVRQALKRKREIAQSSIGVIAALGIPVKKADFSPTFTIPAKRRAKPIRRPEVQIGAYIPEPVLEEKEYLHILEILRNMSLVIERNPASFVSLDEQPIRDLFLLMLNSHYEGGATGETFNKSGKTDILIREGNKNVFIAECKFWSGSKAFGEAVGQLLSYLTWRDSKCALLIFNRTKDSTAISIKMHEAMKSIPEHRKTEFHNPNGDSRYILVKTSEPGKEIIVTTQIYDIPVDK